MGVVLSMVDRMDKSISSKIHNMKSNMIMDYTLAVPGMAFKPLAFPIILAAICYLYPAVEQELNNVENVRDLEDDKRLDYHGPFLCCLYIVNVFTVLGVTTLMKTLF